MGLFKRPESTIKTPEEFEEQRLAMKTISAFLQVILYMMMLTHIDLIVQDEALSFDEKFLALDIAHEIYNKKPSYKYLTREKDYHTEMCRKYQETYEETLEVVIKLK